MAFLKQTFSLKQTITILFPILSAIVSIECSKDAIICDRHHHHHHYNNYHPHECVSEAKNNLQTTLLMLKQQNNFTNKDNNNSNETILLNDNNDQNHWINPDDDDDDEIRVNSSNNWSHLAVNKSLWNVHWKNTSDGLLLETGTTTGNLLPLKDDIGLKAYEEGLLKTLSSRFLSLEGPFDAAKSQSVSPKCRAQSMKFLEGLKNFEMWAMRMYDASAKIPSGILNGNVNQFGDFDQCLNVQSDTVDNIRGQYCLAYLQPEIPDNLERFKHLHQLIQSHKAFKSEFSDPGHRVPRFSTINWALCVPSGCTAMDVETSIREYLQNFTAGTSINFKLVVEPEMCQIRSQELFDRDTIIAASFFIFILLMTLLMTAYDFKSGNKNEWLTTFSLKKNVISMLSFERDSNDIASVHGIRGFNALMLIIAHKSMALFFNPYSNRTEMSECLGKPWTVIGRAASLYTDPFIMLSGLLTTYSLFGRLQRGQSIRVVQEYAGRFLRLVPTLGALILFCTYILPLLGSGPQWNLVVTHHATICKSYWWRNLLFIHNYFGFENMCLTHTHHVGIDTQLFITAPILAYALWKWPRKTVIVILGIAGFSTIARFHVTMTRRLSNYVFFGTSVSQLFDTANYMYILPAHRATVYIMGVLLGYILRKYKDLKLSKTQLKIGWYVNIGLLLVSFFGPAPMGSIDYVYNPVHAAHYAAFAPIMWCSFFAWIIFTSQLGYHTILSRLLSWKGFLVTTRLSYAVYLTQFPVFFYNVGRTRSAEYYEFIRMTLNFNEFLWIIITSMILTLLFDTPFGNIKKLLFKNKSPKSKGRNDGTQDRADQESKLAMATNPIDVSTKEIIYNKNDIRSMIE